MTEKMAIDKKIIDKEWAKIKDTNPWYCAQCDAVLPASEPTCTGSEEFESGLHEPVHMEMILSYNEFSELMKTWFGGTPEQETNFISYEVSLLKKPDAGFKQEKLEKQVIEAIKELNIEIPEEIL